MTFFKRLFRRTTTSETSARPFPFSEDAYLWNYARHIPTDANTLISLLDSPDPNKRVSAARALGKLGHKEAVSHLIKLLGDDRHHINGHQVRVEAATALNQLGEPQWLPLIEGCFHGVDQFPRDLTRLAEVADLRATEPLLYALGQEPFSYGDFSNRILAATLLGRRGDKRAIPAIKSALEAATFDRFRNALSEALQVLEHS